MSQVFSFNWSLSPCKRAKYALSLGMGRRGGAGGTIQALFDVQPVLRFCHIWVTGSKDYELNFRCLLSSEYFFCERLAFRRY